MDSQVSQVDVERLKADVAIVRSEVGHLRTDINKLLKIIVDGNGHSMISRMAVLEARSEDCEERIDETERQKTTVRMAIITSALSVAASIFLYWLRQH